MRATVLALLAGVTAVGWGMLASGAQAAMPADPGALHAAAPLALIRPAAVVCGVGGCAPVHTSRIRRPPRRYRYRKLGH